MRSIFVRNFCVFCYMFIERRKLLQGVIGSTAMYFAGSGLSFAEQLVQKVDEKDDILDFITSAKKMGGVKIFGARLSNLWVDSNNIKTVAYQNAIFIKHSDKEVVPFNILDHLHENGFDTRLESGELGFVVPKINPELSKLDSSDNQNWISNNVPRPMKDHVIILQRNGLEVGKLTSFDDSNQDYCFYRFQNMAFKYWKINRNVESLAVGEIALKVGLIPASVVDISPILNLEPELKILIEAGRFSPSTRSSNRNECASPIQVWSGICTYYSKAGCVGCSPEQRMANGKIFNENAMTMAFMNTPLGAFVTVENLDTGVKVERVEVTDRGGFEQYGILADLSLGLSTRLGNISQKSRIRITWDGC